ncbi:MAG: multidrug efflux SMR transporter [Thioploca sp.]|nr:multidrug efflux SMR transporter [Thioploca sp.]
MNISWLYLFVAILLEVSGTIAMKLSEGFTRMVPLVTMFIFYGFGLTLLTLALKKIELSIAYAIWSGMGTALIGIVGIIWFKESMTALKVISIILIIVGVIGLNLNSEH